VSCRTTSREELASTMPVRPPILNRKINPMAQRRAGSLLIGTPCRETSHLKILMPVGTPITMVAAVK
jgi:hypothetical protein